MRIIIMLALLILSFSTATFAEERKMTFVENMKAKKAERKAKREKAEKNPFLIDVRSKEYTTTLAEKEILSKAKIFFITFPIGESYTPTIIYQSDCLIGDIHLNDTF